MVFGPALVAHWIQFVARLSVFQCAVLICHPRVTVFLRGIWVAHVNIRGLHLRLRALVAIAICDSAVALCSVACGGVALARERKTQCLRREVLCGIIVGGGIDLLVGLLAVVGYYHTVSVRHTRVYVAYLLPDEYLVFQWYVPARHVGYKVVDTISGGGDIHREGVAHLLVVACYECATAEGHPVRVYLHLGMLQCHGAQTAVRVVDITEQVSVAP